MDNGQNQRLASASPMHFVVRRTLCPYAQMKSCEPQAAQCKPPSGKVTPQLRHFFVLPLKLFFSDAPLLVVLVEMPPSFGQLPSLCHCSIPCRTSSGISVIIAMSISLPHDGQLPEISAFMSFADFSLLPQLINWPPCFCVDCAIGSP